MSFRNLSKDFRYINENGGEIKFVFEDGFAINKPNGIDTVSISHSQAQGINQVGSTIQSSNVQSRVVTVNGIFVGTANQQAENKTKLISVIRPDLTAKLYSGEYYLDVRPTATPVIEPKPLFSAFQFSVIAPYPYWQKDSSASATLSGVQKRFKFPWNISGGGTVYNDSGSVVSFNATESTPLVGVVADIEPVQDLHGYGYPWPAGGGKNKANIASIKRGDGSARAGNESISLPAGTYTMSANNVGDCSMTIQFWSSNNNMGTKNFDVGQNSNTITLTDDIVRLYCYISTENYNNGKYGELTTIQIEVGSSPSSYEPYENICPISGWSNVNVYREAQYDAGATPYATINLNGTRYGGSLDVATGVLTGDRSKIVLDSNIPSGTGGVRNITVLENCIRFEYYPYRSIGKGNRASLLSDSFRNENTAEPFTCSTGATEPRMYVCLPSEYNTEALIRSYFASNPAEFVYELATPQTIQLTGQTLPSTLVGANAVWVDSGDVSVQYRKKVGTPYRFGELVTAQFITINNDGQVPVPYTVTFSAVDTVVSPKLIDAYTNEYLLLNKTLVAGEKVVVEITHERTYVNSSVDGECRGALDLGSSFFRLAVGDNVIKPEATSGKSNLNVKIDYAAEIVGIAV